MFHTSLAPPPFAALDGQLSPQSTALASRPWPRLLKLGNGLNGFGIGRPAFLSLSWLFGSGFGFCGTTVMVVLARSPGCPSRHEPARSQGFEIPADNFPNELARVCDSVGKSPAWRGLDAAFSSHFVMLRRLGLTRGGGP